MLPLDPFSLDLMIPCRVSVILQFSLSSCLHESPALLLLLALFQFYTG
jgi:hypothetical protein